ncbi:MAG: DUF4270 domain-containing protein [Prevotella sp.]
MKRTLYILLSAVALLTACDDTTDTIGSSLTNTEDIINVSDNTFRITSRSMKADSVLARSATGYVGIVKDPETGAYIKSNFATQFHVAEDYAFPDKENLAHGVVADSCDLRLFFNSYYGDSLATMKATVYEMARPMEEGVNYYTSFDPEANGMIRVGEGRITSSKVFSLVNTNIKDSVRYSDSYTNNILFSLNQQYKDKDGNVYDNYGSYIMKRYYDNPSDFRNSYTFTHNVCPGFYVKMENGVGAMAYIRSSQMNVYYTLHDSIDHSSYNSFAGTEEMRQVTRIVADNDRLDQLTSDPSCTYVKSPAGLFTELTLPVEEVFRGHGNDSVNSAKIVLRCINDKVESRYSFPKPTTVLLIQKDKIKEFFENKEVANYRTSFVATYSSSDNSYTFGNVGQLIKHIYDSMPENEAEREVWKTQNPDWNKVAIIPVNATYTTYNSSAILSSLSHDMSLSSTRLLGGEGSEEGEITMYVIYSSFNK